MAEENWAQVFIALYEREDTDEGVGDYVAPLDYLISQGIITDDDDTQLTMEGALLIDKLREVDPASAKTVSEFAKGLDNVGENRLQ